MYVFDGHNDTLTQIDGVRAFLDGGTKRHVDLPRAQAGGLAGGLFAIFAPAPPNSPERDNMYGLAFTENGYSVSERSAIDPDYARAYTNAVIDFAYRIEAQANGRVKLVTTAAAIEACFARETLAVVLALEGAEAIQPDLSNLNAYYQKGIRSLGLVWSRPNAFGHGVPFRFPGSPDTGAGLTGAGRALVEACNSLGIVVDLAHLNAAGFRDAAAISRAPLVVTHADVWAICPSTRNLTDDQIDAVADSGGVIGINFETLNTHPQASIDQDVPLTQITQHIDYIANRVGVDHVAFGSDFDGADMPAALTDAAGLPRLIDQLRAQGYDDAAVEKIAYKNWLRVFRETWKS